MRWSTSIAIFLLAASRAFAATPVDTPHLEFVQEYIRELIEFEELRAAAEVELQQKGGNQLSSMIYTSTRMQMALHGDVHRLSGMRLNPPEDFLLPAIIGFYKQKIEIHDQLIATATEFMSGPKPGVDYGKMAADVSRLRAVLDGIDEALFKVTPAVAATLVDEKPDSQGHMSRLIITKAERSDLIKRIQTAFGAKLNQNQQNYYVSSATVLRDWLRSGYTASDEVRAEAAGPEQQKHK